MNSGRIFIVVLCCVFTLSGLSACVSKKPELVDTSKPASYEDYKNWRERFDPEASEFAEFKAWEAEYQRWKRQQK